MLDHEEKVLAHAERQLASRGKQNPADLLALYKKFLKIENHRLQLQHYAGGGGLDIARKRASLVDILLRHLFDYACREAAQLAKPPPDLALVAIGGFGRGELNPFSDVDIMFLQADKPKVVSSQGSEIIQAILYMLWDVGFKVGHSTRSIDAVVKQANADMLSKTSLLEARYLVGDRELFDRFKAEFEKHCVKGFEKDYIEQRIINQADRHSKQGGTVYMQEPNVKNGCGSLRDYQNLLWISYFKDRAKTTADLVERKILSESERRKLDKAYDFLLRVRTELHYLNKRGLDTLTLAFQMQVANKFNYPQKNPLRRNEAFMRDYYQHARTIFHTTETLSDRLSNGILAEQKKHSVISLLLPRRSSKTPEHFDGFYAVGNAMFPESREIFRGDPYRLMRLFQHAQQRQLVLSPELQHLIRRRLHLVDRTFNYARATRETFNAILSRKGEVGRILRMMHEVDFLGRYIPEFGHLTCLVQHEFFHRYTADEHTLVCIEKLDTLIDTAEKKYAGYKALFQRLEDPFVLYLALLLHDTGKASDVRHHADASAVFAQRVAARLQLSSERRKALIFLVNNHITLSSVSQRRNLDDTSTISEFASIVKNSTYLDALMLLTLVDGKGTGDDSWSDWKEGLVWHLYRSTSQYLADSAAYYRDRETERETLQATVMKKLAKDFSAEADAYFECMPEIYFQTYPASEIVSHIRFFRAYLETRWNSDEKALAPLLKWIARPDQGHSEVWVCSWDRKELLAKIAGSFSTAQLNILSADVFTREDSLVIDIFRVCNTNFEAVTDEKCIALVEKNLTQALGEEDYDYDFAPLLKKAMKKSGNYLVQELDFPTRIIIDNALHPTYTLVDIQTPDRLGLLYNLLKGFARAGVNIAMSRIATEKGAAIDSFYVTDSVGRKISGNEALTRLQKSLHTTAGIAPA
jgi:[protein-PII] uridylyltransferase